MHTELREARSARSFIVQEDTKKVLADLSK